MYIKFCLSLMGWIWKFYLLIYVLDGVFSEKIKFSHDSKITVQVFNTLSSRFPQIINLTEYPELAFTERLERLYLIIILLIVLSKISLCWHLLVQIYFIWKKLKIFQHFFFFFQLLNPKLWSLKCMILNSLVCCNIPSIGFV